MSDSGFIWYELLTDDTAAAARFYAAVLGWSARNSGLPGDGYHFFSTGECDIGGLMTLPPGAKAMGARPQWLPYLSVPDVDASVASIAAAGGTVQMPPTDIPGTGRFAMVADPQGARFYVMAPIGEGPSPAYRPGVSGHGGWHELHTRDWRAAREFYAGQFGWRTVQEMDPGPPGTYLQFDAGETAGEGAGPAKAIGGMMDVPDIGRPHWLVYFNVDDLDAAKRRLVVAGGTLDGDVHQVPGDDWILRARDPQGAAFALLGPRWERHRAV
jgi:predicted enzyme related to lactoylglutathione lyase